MARKARVEGGIRSAPVGDEKPAIIGHPASEDLANIVEAFKAAHPDDWEALRLCPLQHGLADMIEKLKG